MSVWIELNEGTAARRRVPCRIFLSDGTSPDTGALNDAVIMGTNSLGTFSLSSTLRAVNANQGMYCIELSQSECSVLGTHPLLHAVGDFPQHIATIQVVNSNHFSTLSAISDVTLHAGTHSSATIQGVTRVNSAVTLNADTHSGATIQGLSNYANISNVTLHAGTHSNVTIQGLSNYANISNVTLHAGTHSNVTVQGVTRTLNLSANDDKTGYGVTSIAAGSYSGVSVEVIAGGIQAASLGAGTITSAKFASGAIDAVALATDAGQEIADRFILRGLQGGNDSDRSVGQALAVLRNRVDASSSTGTVYQVDDTTSLWTFSVTTGAFPIQAVDPG